MPPSAGTWIGSSLGKAKAVDSGHGACIKIAMAFPRTIPLPVVPFIAACSQQDEDGNLEKKRERKPNTPFLTGGKEKKRMKGKRKRKPENRPQSEPGARQDITSKFYSAHLVDTQLFRVFVPEAEVTLTGSVYLIEWLQSETESGTRSLCH